MNRPHTFSPASSLSYSNQVGSRQVTQPLRCVESPAGAGGAAVWWERVTGDGIGNRGRGGQPSALCKYGRGCPGFLLGAGPSLLCELIFSGVKAELLSPSWSFLPFREEKGKQRNKKSSVAATHPKGEHQAKGREGAGEAWQVLPPAEVPSGVSDKDPLPAGTAHCVQGRSHCSGGSLQGSIPDQGIVPASPHLAPHLPDRFLWKAPQPWHIQQHQGGRHLPVPPGFFMAVPRD